MFWFQCSATVENWIKASWAHLCSQQPKKTSSPQSRMWTSMILNCAHFEKGTLLHCWWECQLALPLWRTVRRFLRKLKTELPHDPTIPLLDIYLEKNMIQKDTWAEIFTAALFIIAKTWKQPKCPTEERIKKMWYFIYDGILLSY